MNVVCSQYENHYESNPPIPTTFLRELMRLILEENSFKFHNRHFVQTRGIAVGTKMAVAFSIIYMADFEERLLKASPHKPLVWKRFIDDTSPCGSLLKQKLQNLLTSLTHSIPLSNSHVKCRWKRCFPSDTEVFKGPHFSTLKLLDVRTHFKPTIHTSHPVHPINTKRGFIKGEALRLLRTNSIKANFEKLKRDFEVR